MESVRTLSDPVVVDSIPKLSPYLYAVYILSTNICVQDSSLNAVYAIKMDLPEAYDKPAKTKRQEKHWNLVRTEKADATCSADMLSGDILYVINLKSWTNKIYLHIVSFLPSWHKGISYI